MALEEAITQSSGYDANYWRLTNIDIDWANGRANVTLKGYKDEQARKDNPRGAVMDTRRFTIQGEYFDKFFAVPDLSQISSFDDTVEYGTGELVVYENAVWEAKVNVPSGEPVPAQSEKWALHTDLRLNREVAYEYVKKSTEEFSNALDV